MSLNRQALVVVVLGGLLVGGAGQAFAHQGAGSPLAHRDKQVVPALVDQAPEKPLSLEDAIAIAIANNPGLAATSQEAAAARARRMQASAERWPRLTVAGSFTRHLDEQRLLPVRQPGDPAVLSRDILAADLVLSMPLLTGGRLSNQVAASALLEDAAEQRALWTREDLVLEVTSLFYQILAQGEAIQSLAFARRTMEEHLGRVDALIAAKKAAAVDRLRSEVRLANVDHSLAQERARLAIQYETFASLLGQSYLGAEITLEGPLTEPIAAPLPEASAALAQALAARADYAAARSVVEAKTRGVDAARGARWPAVYLLASYGGRQAMGDWTGTGEEIDDTGRVGVALELPLFDGGRITAAVSEQRALLAAERERLRQLEQRINLEVTTALLNLGSARSQAAALVKAVDQAHETLRIEQQKYELGKGAVIDVLDAQSALLYTQTSYYRALAEWHASLAQLRLASGISSRDVVPAREPSGRTP